MTGVSFADYVRKNVVLINPPIVAAKGDISGTGAVYWPIVLAYVAEIVRPWHNVRVVDMFGMNPTNRTEDSEVYRFGIDYESIGKYIKKGDVVVLYSGLAVGHNQALKLIKEIKKTDVESIIVIENPNSVNACPLDIYAKNYKELGCVVIPGYPFGCILDAIDGNFKYRGRVYFDDFDSLNFPKWFGFPIVSYWNLNHAHAPKTDKKYVQIYTSWGCPNSCKFCSAPHLSGKKWFGRSAENVVDEMKYWNRNGVFEFHIEDLNPTVDKKRIEDICQLMDTYGIVANLKIAAGTRMDDLDEKTIIDLGRHGLSYLSFSPESGYWVTLMEMNKSFNYDHALKMLDVINDRKKVKNGMITQACFIVGYPGTGEEELDRTMEYIGKMIRHGLDEVGLFGFCPTPGSEFWKGDIKSENINFSSMWCKDGKRIRSLRRNMALLFYLGKMWYSPIKTVLRLPKTKTWMTFRRLGFDIISGLK